MNSPLDHTLAEVVRNFAAKRPKSAALQERAKAVMPGGNTRTVLYSAPFPIRAEKAEGPIVTDVDGLGYIDLVGEYSAGLFGHSHPRIKEVVTAALAGGLNFGMHHEGEVTFAEAVCQRFNLELVRFTNSGTEANMMALAAARCFTGRPKIMPMEGGYHGGTLYFSHGASPVNAPFDCVLGHFNNVEATVQLIDRHKNELAAVILEPMLGGGGCLPTDADFLAMLRQKTTQHGIVLIFDEVMTSRLDPGGLAARFRVTPDLKTLGKYVGGGMSFGAFGGKRDIMAQFDPSQPNALPHAGTFNNNTLTMAAGRVAIGEIYTPNVCRAHNAAGDTLRAAINDLAMRHQARLCATGIGSMMTLHPLSGPIARPEDSAKADQRLRRLLYLDLLEDGLYIAERGFMALSLAIEEQHREKLLQALDRFLERRKPLLLS